MPVTFTKVKLPFGWLGNMAAYPLQYKGKTWRTPEALFQALRFKDETIQERIREQTSPMAAKLIAKRYAEHMVVTPASEEDMENMEIVLRLKLEQHPDLKMKLLETGDQTIIEDITNRPTSGRHSFWGMALVNGEWIGQNNLGNIWMKLRQELKEGNHELRQIPGQDHHPGH